MIRAANQQPCAASTVQKVSLSAHMQVPVVGRDVVDLRGRVLKS
jgi:hypothetical protein